MKSMVDGALLGKPAPPDLLALRRMSLDVLSLAAKRRALRHHGDIASEFADNGIPLTSQVFYHSLASEPA